MNLAILHDEDKWGWAGNRPDPEECGRDLHELTARETRLLGEPALKLYLRLERRRGWEGRWFGAKLKDIASELEMPERTAKRALARLRDCGAVETRCLTEPWKDDPETGQSRVGRRLLFRVWGAWDLRKGKLRVLLPKHQWRFWVRGKSQWGGRRRGAGRPFSRAENNQVGPNPSNPATRDQALSNQVGPTITILLTRVFEEEVTLSSKDSADGRQTAARALEEEKKPMAQTPLPSSAELEVIDTLAPRPQLQPRRNPYRVPERSELPREILAAIELHPEMSNPTRAEVMLTAYRRAVKKHYGKCPVKTNGLTWGEEKRLRLSHPVEELSIVHSRDYRYMVAAAEVLTEHSLPPDGWADWYVEKLKEWGAKGGAWGKKPPPLRVVFSAKTILKRRGWYHKEWDGPSGWRPVLDQVHQEQELRIREVNLLNRGFSPDSALHSLPDWYAEKRRGEIRRGAHDPNTCFPSTKR